ncbi:MAG: hypothetical protein K9W46_00295 [Candidatus Heimdallarchaeum endolithica]|uniref:Uncharacterized protein n=1 Tax=Candidatus Heimdallarchaeum endolithica TaxID=2876572 RepID=A0A9Y1BRJ4_9ARCH|nr:MAG: hypothetical protein K9W46_00295 [Candidatus Heimdallarchaeum endolithica]
MVLTEADLVAKTPIKKPKTFNPLGAVLTGFFIAEGFVLIFNSLVNKSINAWYSLLGTVLVLFSILSYSISVSLTTKKIEFFRQLEKTYDLKKSLIVESILFYIGFTPVYGFFFAYGVKGVPLWVFFAVIVFSCLTFSVFMIFNIHLLQREESRMFHLLQSFYQPKKWLLLLISVLIIVSSLVFLIFVS